MRNILYIGKYTLGQTSRMRGELLKEILMEDNITVIDIDIPFFGAPRLFRSLAFKFKVGPLIGGINRYILRNIRLEYYDMIWVDKGIYLTVETTKKLRSLTSKLVHFTPDPAFFYHKSNHFYKSIKLYDYAITTKSFEIESYEQALGKSKVLYCTQGYDSLTHKPFHKFSEKAGIVFIGHCEVDRELIMQEVLNSGIKLKLAGINWNRFLAKNIGNENLEFVGNGLYGEEYSRLISSGYLSIGLLSKYIPEEHTTRTFEIPACGTALLTEETSEIRSIFSDNEVYYFKKNISLGEHIKDILADLNKLEKVTQNGMKKVQDGHYDYRSILQRILNNISFK